MRYSSAIFTLVMCLTLVSLAAGQDGTPRPRTYYETLDLSNPEAAINTFSDAFRRDDYFTVYLVLDELAQRKFVEQFRLFRYESLYNITYQEAVEADIPLFTLGFGSTEHVPDSIFIFDDLMLAVAKHDAFLIDLRGNLSILRSTEMSGAVDVYTRVENIEDEVIFRMVQAPSGRWRVRQVILPGGDEEQIPWSVPTALPSEEPD